MFSFNRSARTQKSPAARRAILSAECLEARDTPTNLAPVISEFTASQAMAGIYMFSGRVTDEHANGLTIYFGGGTTSVTGLTVETDEDGWFSIAVEVNTDGTDVGCVTAYTVDDANQTSNTVMEVIIP